MTLREVAVAMRKAGFRTSEATIRNGIVSGRYPFGSVLGQGRTGRYTLEILRVDFTRWLDSVT